MMITIGFLLDLFLFANSDGVVVVVVAKAVAMLEALLLMMLLQQERKEAVVVIVVFFVVVVTCVVDNSSVAILWISRNVCRRCDTPSVFASRGSRSSTGGSHHH